KEGQFVREGGFNKPWSMYLNQKLDVKAPFRDCPTLSYFFVTPTLILCPSSIFKSDSWFRTRVMV
ncbi:MAG: hypothetical protein AB4368_13120, partial [Xenococcaceae cyanobacterium]